MRILIASHWFLKLVVPQQAVALRDRGHEVALLTGSHSYEFGEDPSERADHLASFGLDHFEIGPEAIFHRSGIAPLLASARQIREWQPDVVSVHQNTDPFMLAAVHRFPIAYTIHDPEPHPGSRRLSRLERLTESEWLRRADALVIHSRLLTDQLPDRLRSDPRLGFVPHGVDVDSEPLPVPDDPMILMFGRLESYKGVSLLMQAMRKLWLDRPRARLLVAGRGPAAADVIDDPRIELVDRYVAEKELPGLLARARVMVLPYIQASQSGPGLLAIAKGIPTVVTHSGGLPDLVDVADRVARSGDPQDLARALGFALDEGSDARRRILEFARTRFSWPTVAFDYEAVLAQISGP